MKLEDKVALITGGNSGIGLATAKLFQKEGAKVIITGRRQEVVASATQEIGGSAIGITNDTSNLSDIDSLYDEIEKLYGKIDVLFLNAGIASFSPIEGITEELFDSQFNINVKGLYFNIQKALPLMKDGGSIILTTSSAGQTGSPNTSVYSATKAAVRSLARTLSAELLERGIRVNCVAPGPIKTPIFGKLGMPEEMVGQVMEQVTSTVPMKRFGAADEVANAALFLASDDSGYVAGIDLAVDGGIVSI
jgi:NAD(P)-dependent dehydrogenase (short-subunit alcohol dehydrogenase family)